MFEPPPVLRGSPDGGNSVRSSRASLSGRFSRQSLKRDGNKEKKKSKSGGSKSRMEEFEIDVESQNSNSWKLERKEKKPKKEKLPFLIRVVKALFKATFWVVTIGFRALAAIVAGLAKCLHAEKR